MINNYPFPLRTNLEWLKDADAQNLEWADRCVKIAGRVISKTSRMAKRGRITLTPDIAGAIYTASRVICDYDRGIVPNFHSALELCDFLDRYQDQ